MSNYKTILKYEYKKVFQKKIFWITLVIMIGISISMVLASMMSETTAGESYYSKIQSDKKDALALNGTPIDDSLVEHFRESGERMPNELESFLSTVYDSYDIKGYTGDIYEERGNMLTLIQKSYSLSEGERINISKLEESIEKPIVFQYCEGYKKMIAVLYTLGMMELLFIAICIPSVFADEHNKKMDQLNLCSRFGRKELVISKIVAGITLSWLVTLILVISTAIPTFVVYGHEGFSAPIQLIYPLCSYSLTVGETAMLLLGLTFIINTLRVIVIMLFTEVLKNVLAVTGIVMGGLILSLAISIPFEFRVISEIWNMIPTNMLAIWGFLDVRFIHLFGHYFTQYQIVPIIYAVLAVIGCVGIRGSYLRYQVS